MPVDRAFVDLQLWTIVEHLKISAAAALRAEAARNYLQAPLSETGTPA